MTNETSSIALEISRDAACAGQRVRLAAIGFTVAGILGGAARGQDAPAPGDRNSAGSQQAPITTMPALEVNGTATVLPHDVPQSISTVSQQEMTEQAVSSLTDVLRNVPGITLNAGEGGAHGDSVNLRGLSVPDSFFLDGLRDIGLYQRDTFDEEAVEVLLGPSSVLFGRGSTAGVINQVTKQASLTPFEAADVEVGTAHFERATADADVVLGGHSAARLNLMEQSYNLADRDDVLIRGSGIAPTVAFGIDTPTTFTLSYLHQYENDIPDYGIPFIDGVPAHVNRRNYYGLTNYDKTQNRIDIGTARFEHTFSDKVSLIDSLQCGHYDFTYLLSAPHLDDDYTDVPAPGTPLADILVYRDQPSSAGREKDLINRTDLTAKFDTGGLEQTLITGVELSSEGSDVTKYINGIDVIPPTPILEPAASYSPPTALDTDTLPHTSGSDVSVSAMDRMRLDSQWAFDGGLRWDSFSSHYSESTTGSAFSRNDTELSPRAAFVFKPTPAESFYASYGSSYNPALEYLVIAPSSRSLAPEKDYTAELGTKLDFMGTRLRVTAALFDTLLDNARQSDPDDPTVQQLPFDQRVVGTELGISGYITDEWEIQAAYTHLDDRITASTDPLALPKRVPGIPEDSINFWLRWEPGGKWQIGTGAIYQSGRFADVYDTASVPSYVVFNAMVSYRVNRRLDLQVNLNNVADRLYFNSIYYTETDENHAVPAPGRTLLLTARMHF